MGWIPASGWLTKVAVDGQAAQLSYDLAVDASGAGAPRQSRRDWRCRAPRPRRALSMSPGYSSPSGSPEWGCSGSA